MNLSNNPEFIKGSFSDTPPHKRLVNPELNL